MNIRKSTHILYIGDKPQQKNPLKSRVSFFCFIRLLGFLSKV
nr:MAG TPA: hypothetical protein [Caudoviricetes sp.]